MRNFNVLAGAGGAGVWAIAAGCAFGQSGLVINEVDYDQDATDTAEFVELYNPTGADVDLTGYELVFVNGALSPSTTYLRVQLAPQLSVPAGGYLVVGASTLQDSLPPGTRFIAFSLPSNNIQNGAPDGIALINTATQTVVDTLSYEGSVTQASVTGFDPSPFNLVQGTPLTLADPNGGSFSLQRYPNGRHTGEDSQDWALRAPTPGVSNSGGCTNVEVSSTYGPDAVCPGATKTYSAAYTASGTFSLLWTRNDFGLDFNDPRITVVNAGGVSTLTIANVAAADAGTYALYVGNECSSAASAPGLLFVGAADLGTQGGQPGADGVYDNNDFIVFIDAFFNHLPSADVGGQGGVLTQDGQWDNNDFVVFINLFFAGCP